MLSDFSDELNTFFQRSRWILSPWLTFIGVLWAFNSLNWILGSRLNALGLYPRRLSGLIGILFCPILHKNFNHLFFNTVPLFVLGLVLLARGVHYFYWITTWIVVVGGFAVWLVGRPAQHIGASGVISGYFGCIMMTAYLNTSFITVLLACLVLYYFGGIFLGIFPREERVSWESHLLGFLSGITAASISPTSILRSIGF